jgi:hypothetical protein
VSRPSFLGLVVDEAHARRVEHARRIEPATVCSPQQDVVFLVSGMACKCRPFSKRPKGFEPSNFCMASRTCSAESAPKSLQTASFSVVSGGFDFHGVQREITGTWAPNGHPSMTRWLRGVV